jgi:pyrroline-5-carboxylate reductase
LVIKTLYGTAKLLVDKNLKFEEVIARVATKGGITEEGVKVLKSGLPEVFAEMFNQTMDKRKRVNEMVNKDFES